MLMGYSAAAIKRGVGQTTRFARSLPLMRGVGQQSKSMEITQLREFFSGQFK
jgi:hypothetical protein